MNRRPLVETQTIDVRAPLADVVDDPAVGVGTPGRDTRVVARVEMDDRGTGGDDALRVLRDLDRRDGDSGVVVLGRHHAREGGVDDEWRAGVARSGTGHGGY